MCLARQMKILEEEKKLYRLQKEDEDRRAGESLKSNSEASDYKDKFLSFDGTNEGFCQAEGMSSRKA